MSSIDVALTMNAWRELTTLDGAALEVDRCLEREQPSPWVELHHDHRLRKVPFGQISPMNSGRLARDDSNRLDADLENGCGVRHCLRGSLLRAEQERCT